MRVSLPISKGSLSQSVTRLLGLLLIIILFSGCFLSAYRDVAFVSSRWKPGANPVSIEDESGLLLESEKEMLHREKGLSGTINVFRYFSTGSGKGSRILLVLQEHPLSQPVFLPIPDGTSGIYIQNEDGWQIIPEDALFIDQDDAYLRLETIKDGEIYVTKAYYVTPSVGESVVGGLSWPMNP